MPRRRSDATYACSGARAGAQTDGSMLSQMPEALIVDAVRSPIGKRNGTLASLPADALAGQVLNALVARHDLDPAEVEDVQMGCVSPVGEQGWNIGRMAPLAAGWPQSVCGTTVDRQCGSSMQYNFNAAAAVSSGQLDLVVSAGVESMSRVPMDSSGGEVSEALLERWELVPQGISAELIADEWGLTREELDAYSRDRDSPERARAARAPVRPRHDVHRLRPSDRRGDRAHLTGAAGSLRRRSHAFVRAPSHTGAEVAATLKSGGEGL